MSDAVAGLGADLATFAMVEERLVEAWGFLARMPDRERGLHRVRAAWPDILRHNYFGDYADMDADAPPPRAPGLRSAEVDRMEEALDWVKWVPERHRRLIGIVLGMLQKIDDPDWMWVAERMPGGVRADACRKRYNRALARICERLNTAENRGV